jgi:small subunit ribosomal protein S6
METAYEVVYIMDTTLPEEQSRSIVEKYSSVVTRSGGVVDDIDRLEPRRLAYPIKGRREGHYVVMNFHSAPTAKDELDRIFRISDDVLRHLIVRQDPKADRFPSKTRSSEIERREREFAARTGGNSNDSNAVTDLGAIPAAAPAVAARTTNTEDTAADETPSGDTAAEETSEGTGSPD